MVFSSRTRDSICVRFCSHGGEITASAGLGIELNRFHRIWIARNSNGICIWDLDDEEHPILVIDKSIIGDTSKTTGKLIIMDDVAAYNGSGQFDYLRLYNEAAIAAVTPLAGTVIIIN